MIQTCREIEMKVAILGSGAVGGYSGRGSRGPATT